MKPKKKEKDVAHSEENFASVIDELTEAMVEEVCHEKADALEPFEQYAQKVRSKMHADFTVFRSRFVKGYNALLEEIVHEQEVQVKKPPSKST